MNLAPVRLATVAACALLAVPALAAAQSAVEPEAEAQSGEEVAAEPGKAEPETNARAKEAKRICRRIRTDMSSRRAKRVCLTADEWREFNQRR